MQHSVSKFLALSAIGFMTLAQVHADPLILGSVAFDGLGLTPFTLDNPGITLAGATKFTSINAWVSTVSGAYTDAAHGGSGPVSTFGTGLFGGSVNFTDFTFAPPQAPPPMLLWTFTDSGVTYSFTADTMTATFVPGSDQWLFGGTGFASITGYANTEGSWQLSAAESMSPGSGGPVVSFGFDSDAVAAGSLPPTVPDGGLTVMTLGSAFLGLGFLRKKWMA